MGNLDFFPPERITDQYLWSQNIKVISAGLIKRKAVFMLVQINTKVWSMLNLNLIKTMEILVFAKLNSKSGGKGPSCKILRASCCWLNWKYYVHCCFLLFQHSLCFFSFVFLGEFLLCISRDWDQYFWVFTLFWC